MPKFTLDGKEIEFQQGETIIKAAADAGIEIPHFCYHPKLSLSGNCRVCLVEVEKMPKLVIACMTMAAEGMVVHSKSEKTLEARNAVMEFLLINHPLDCPICDEAGECKLQDYAYAHGTGESSFVEEKNHKRKRVNLGPRIIFDGERCISCSRCIRFSDEISKENQLTFADRGDHVTIVTFPGEEFDNPYTLNTVDICPVGALTSKDFRFQSRVWEMSSTKSICTGCATGCNTEIWVRDNKIGRLTPRQNDNVNEHWMCDGGRLETWKHINSDSRIDGPSVKQDGTLHKTEWNDAINETVNRLKEVDPDKIAFIGSAYSSVEDNFLLKELADHLEVKNIDFMRHVTPGGGDDILISEDKTPNTMGAELSGVKPANGGKDINGIINGIEAGEIKALVVMEDDLFANNDKAEELASKLDLLIVFAVNENGTTKYADVLFPASSYAEKHAVMVNKNGYAQRLRPAIAAKEMDRSLDQMSLSRWDKFGTQFDRWARGHKYDCRPSWNILASIGNGLGADMKYSMAEEVFDAAAGKIDYFNGINYDDIGELGIRLKNVLAENSQTV